MIKIAPSLLAADILNLARDVKMLEESGAHWLHIDVMDGMFVPNITFGPQYVSALRKITNLVLDVHLMVEKPERYIEDFCKAGADYVTVHCEATPHLDRTLQLIKFHGKKTGVALNPATDVRSIKYVLDKLDMVLLMSVNPGFGGQQFIESTYDKLNELKDLIGERKIEIQVDGGVNDEIGTKLVACGATVLVAGSYILNHTNPKKAIDLLKNISKN
ncbi:ribulose-phosphate 3-epimerase [Anaerobranca californiensis DSM 14826]|jgi:ribulose-phosphate 3-epimerase|uniref:Ribulose-phosphate 3-epimerase n=1 Tax=Anaerobranca californiensis DSM 14826 TaxID=1120989 RepID=A0A1M6KQ77_9FIRM|nr:ribulose-phosphate 3-epimerase [Anaerobranca californiensis]SHJ61042.1 ribulose-phosphate 3-epimerase [Anaerobranca californiensis DSM 14826]